MTYSTEDFENWTIQKLFDQYVRPLIVNKNPEVSKEAIQKVMDAKWKEFAIMNPYIPKGEEGLFYLIFILLFTKELEDDFDDVEVELQDDDVSDVRITPTPGRKRGRGSIKQNNANISIGYTTPLSACAGSEVASQSPLSPQATTPPLKIKITKKRKRRGRKRADVSKLLVFYVLKVVIFFVRSFFTRIFLKGFLLRLLNMNAFSRISN